MLALRPKNFFLFFQQLLRDSTETLKSALESVALLVQIFLVEKKWISSNYSLY